MDFYQIKERSLKNGVIEIYPDFKICRSRDLMVRGKAFYAIWDKEAGLWSTDEYDVQRLVDEELTKYYEERKNNIDGKAKLKLLGNYSSKSWIDFKNYVSHLSDNARDLDCSVLFSNSKVRKTDYASRRLDYPLQQGDCSAYEELISTLYDPEDRDKLEWAIGSIIAGDSRTIQKFIVLYGEQGSGKSTILNIIQQLFNGYYTTFEAKALASNSNAFSTEVFKANPLVAIQHDGDLSKIEDNTKINSIVSHEEMVINEKFKSSYTSKINAFLFMGTNKPVKITDAKSGIIRRLIDVRPSGRKIPPKKYDALYSQVSFELGAIAYHCLEVYRKLGKNYYQSYKPLEMMFKTDAFFNFVESCYDIFKDQNGCTLSQAYDLYKKYCDDSLVDFKLARYKFREELKNYFKNFDLIARVDGKQVRSYYSEFLTNKFVNVKIESEEKPNTLVLDQNVSLFDEVCKDCLAQYASRKEVPLEKWDNVDTVLEDLNTRKLHYVKLPENHIVIDFDLKDSDGKKSAELNLAAASQWPATYAEYSKGGKGIHLHYFYNGDVTKLKRLYSENIEIKVFTGKGALRRRLTKCNNIPIATLNGGLPLREEKNVINYDIIKSEKKLRDMIEANLRKEYHPSTASSVSFIHKLLEDAYNSGMKYDLTNMRPTITYFAANSTNQSENCLKLVADMKFKSDEPSENSEKGYTDDVFSFFDIEVYPNYFLVCWKYRGENIVHSMENPKPHEIDELFKKKLIGFNNRKYDNHTLYGAHLGYNNGQLYNLSSSIVNKKPDCYFGEAYNLSYTDIYDFCQKKQSLKKWEIELGIHHMEMGIPWDQPLPDDMKEKVKQYCCNDVIATEAVFEHNIADFNARLILADLSGLTANDTTNSHSKRFIFGKERHPQSEFVYTDLSTIFPGYEYNPYGIDKSRYNPDAKIVNGKSIYKGQDPSEGGFVYAEPGVYGNVGLYDIASMHPTSIECLNLFGDKYTAKFSAIKNARLAIKHLSIAYENNDQNAIEKLSDELAGMFDGKLVKYIGNPEQLKPLSGALKIVINSVYGLTSAKFENEFKDPRNVDNIVAKRGALFMIELKDACEKAGYKVVHIKTDSIKIANANDEIRDFVMEFGKKYGYTFEHEATYDKMCLVNDAVYIAKYSDDEVNSEKKRGTWTATGAQFAHPYVFKTLFSHDPITFQDKCETKSVTSKLYLDMNEDCDDVTLEEKELEKRQKMKRTGKNARLNPDFKDYSDEWLEERIASGHRYEFIGRVGLFCPIKPGYGGGALYREQDGKYYAVAGTSGFRWLEAETVMNLYKEDAIDLQYFDKLVQDAASQILLYTDLDWFCSDEKYTGTDADPIWPF